VRRCDRVPPTTSAPEYRGKYGCPHQDKLLGLACPEIDDPVELGESRGAGGSPPLPPFEPFADRARPESRVERSAVRDLYDLCVRVASERCPVGHQRCNLGPDDIAHELFLRLGDRRRVPLCPLSYARRARRNLEVDLARMNGREQRAYNSVRGTTPAFFTPNSEEMVPFRRLPAVCQLAMFLRHVLGYSQTQTAMLLGLSRQNLRTIESQIVTTARTQK
jgi:DNA-directed RNA polymerase specialized sigma24 family protein